MSTNCNAPTLTVSELVKIGLKGITLTILECKRCQLHENVINKVIMRGSERPKVLFIGEAPGKSEDEAGIPFCGRAGKVLDGLINYMDLDENEYAIINTVKCRPPNNRKPTQKELKTCIPFLFAQIEILDPKVIILLGNTAEQAFSVSSLCWGEAVITPEGKHLIKLYHPAALLYRRSLMEKQKEMIDMNKALWQKTR
ncbi:uracil-DNA glycosylase [uncultured Methanomethylovorans sp.]|uniref:uracil-DNA glycosylase n=1 Tax=uncultured Methanomethylovorans sp. TaxID=183759 RepID=UPI002AA88C43|nr:uracil-DNA glycosylase [uncultured Methanomethylovorans sp.]